MVAVFYANDGIITLPKPARTQLALNVLTGLFDRVGLQTNVSNMVGMVCQPCYIFGIHLEAAYTRRMMGVCPYFWEWQRERFRCPECELELAAGPLEDHHQAQMGRKGYLNGKHHLPHFTPGYLGYLSLECLVPSGV